MHQYYYHVANQLHFSLLCETRLFLFRNATTTVKDQQSKLATVQSLMQQLIALQQAQSDSSPPELHK